jgi:hypothetical protein
VAKKIKEKIPYFATAIFLLLAIGVFIYLNILQNENAKNKRKIDSSLTFNTIVVSACDIFTLRDAQKLLSKNVEVQDTTVGAEGTDDIDVSACSYSIPFRTVEELAKAKTASVFIRTPKNIKGANINYQAFTIDLPAKAESIEGYGQRAYWNPDRSQLNVYKDGNWLIFSSGALDVNNRTLEEAKKLADAVMPKI